eukprot:COSAG05_NODE_16618_length_342_cov_0.633745_1_plen_40_part_01
MINAFAKALEVTLPPLPRYLWGIEVECTQDCECAQVIPRM